MDRGERGAATDWSLGVIYHPLCLRAREPLKRFLNQLVDEEPKVVSLTCNSSL